MQVVINISEPTNSDLRNRVMKMGSPFTLAYRTNMSEMPDGASIQWSKLKDPFKVQAIYFANKVGGRSYYCHEFHETCLLLHFIS